MNQDKHLFQFTGAKIAAAAEAEKEYHLARQVHWLAEQSKLIERAKALTATVSVREQPVTGYTLYQVVADITGVQDINQRLSLCGSKIADHRRVADEYALKAAAYATQPERAYELDPNDVQYFRLAGGSRAT